MCSSMPLRLFLAKIRRNTLVRGVHIRRCTTARHAPYRMNEAMVHELETQPSRSLPCCGLSWPSEHRSELVRPPGCSELPSCIVCGLCHTNYRTERLRPKRCSSGGRRTLVWVHERKRAPYRAQSDVMADALIRIDCMVSTRFQEIGVR